MPYDQAQKLVDRLDFVRPLRDGQWIARCPAHNDKSPSLSVTELDDGRVLIHCHAGCGAADVVASVGMSLTDLFPPWSHYKRVMPRGRRSLTEDDFLLEICRESRRRGERLTEAEKRREYEAWRRLNRRAG